MQRPCRQDLYPSALSCEDMQAEMLISCDVMLAGVPGQHLPEGVQEQEDAVILLHDIPRDGFQGLACQNSCGHVN